MTFSFCIYKHYFNQPYQPASGSNTTSCQ